MESLAITLGFLSPIAFVFAIGALSYYVKLKKEIEQVKKELEELKDSKNK
jgi:cell division protein FtsB